MPILMDGHPQQIHCHKCRRCGHIARECCRGMKKACTNCGDLKH
jgi:hypothetical protein